MNIIAFAGDLIKLEFAPISRKRAKDYQVVQYRSHAHGSLNGMRVAVKNPIIHTSVVYASHRLTLIDQIQRGHSI